MPISMPPEVLVILPTLGDRLDSLAESLASVAALKEEIGLTLVAVIPVDAREARELAVSFGAVIVDDPRSGISAAINRGLAARTVEKYYAWVGDDDLLLPGGLVLLKEILEHADGAVLAYGGCEYIDADGRVIATSDAGWLARALLPWGPDLIPHPSSLIRLDALEAIGGFDVALKYAMDLDALLNLRSLGTFVWTREVVSAFRWHPESLTVANRSASSAEAERVKRRHLPSVLRPISPLWHVPVRWASAFAAQSLNRRAVRLRAERLRP